MCREFLTLGAYAFRPDRYMKRPAKFIGGPLREVLSVSSEPQFPAGFQSGYFFRRSSW
jgi:hypothetical protein